MCSMYVLNPDITWKEPWRFVTYSFVHSDIGHLLTNSILQLFFGVPLELSHSSWRVALVYFLGIAFGGLGRDYFTSSKTVLAGASGKNVFYVEI